jgi:hypothetical protein
LEAVQFQTRGSLVKMCRLQRLLRWEAHFSFLHEHVFKASSLPTKLHRQTTATILPNVGVSKHVASPPPTVCLPAFSFGGTWRPLAAN